MGFCIVVYRDSIVIHFCIWYNFDESFVVWSPVMLSISFVQNEICLLLISTIHGIIPSSPYMIYEGVDFF